MAHTELDLRERRAIEDMLNAKMPAREMARVLKRHKSTIFREIKRNFWADDAFPKKYSGYFDHAAQLQTDKRRSVQRKLIRHPELCKTVVTKIKLGWTPEQIGNRMICASVNRVFFIRISSFILPRKFYFRIPLRSGGLPAEVFREKIMEEMGRSLYPRKE